MKKKYLIDIYHIPQLNLFKNAIKMLRSEQVDLCCVNRGKLVEIIEHELPDYNLHIIGDYKHNKGRFNLATKIVIPRLFKLYQLINKNNYDVVGTASYQANLVSRFLSVKNFSIMDDPRSFIVKILNFSTPEFYLPLFNKKYGKAKSFNALKEWAYLSTNYFSPQEEVLNEFGLKKKEYLFFREVSTKTSNYLNQDANLILRLSKKIVKNLNVVLSLENKENSHLYPSNWIILKEPVLDIHSLMYYSSIVVSSGDSMAREGAMLGVPSLYLGYRNMPANTVLINKNLLFKLNVEGAIDFINKNKEKKYNQERIREILLNEWDDVTELIIKLFNK